MVTDLAELVLNRTWRRPGKIIRSHLYAGPRV